MRRKKHTNTLRRARARPLAQVDPCHLWTPVAPEEYVPPEDVLFDQIWDPNIVSRSSSPPLPSASLSSNMVSPSNIVCHSRGGGGLVPDTDELIKEFAGVVSQDKVRRELRGAGGDAVAAMPAV